MREIHRDIVIDLERDLERKRSRERDREREGMRWTDRVGQDKHSTSYLRWRGNRRQSASGRICNR